MQNNKKSIPNEILLVLEKYIPKSDWKAIKKISIKYEVFTFLNWISIFGFNFHKKYYLRVTFNNNVVTNFKLTKVQKNILKPWILKINYLLSSHN
jgi:hypothetical protein